MSEIPKYTKEQLHNFDDLPSAVLVNVDDGKGGLKYAYSNPFLARSLDYSHEEFQKLLTDYCFAAIYEADIEKTKNARKAVRNGDIVDSITRQKKKDGSFVWILAHIRKIFLDGKEGMLFLFSGIQGLIGLQNELSEKNKTWSDILQSVPVGLLVYKEEKGIKTVLSANRFLIDFANDAGSRLDSRKREWTEAELSMVLNQDIYAFGAVDDIPLIETMISESTQKASSSCIFRLRGSEKTSPIYILATCFSKETGEDSRTYYVTYNDVTESENSRIELIKNQKQLYSLSYYDMMTGVKNRNSYNMYVKQCRTCSIKNVGVAFCDINGLKQTNDKLGHSYGDKKIKFFASILKASFNLENIYRLSGDEFVIIYPDIDRQEFMDRMDAMISRVQDEGAIASIGYIWKEKVSDIQRRTTQAEQIMYVEKQRYYEMSRTIHSKHRPQMLNKLLKELEEKRFVMFLQPKTSIDGSKVIGAESLARKIDDNGEIVLPYAFVPQLENEKLIPKLDFYMLEETCRFLENLHNDGKEDFSVSVNVSRVTIVENDFIRTVSDIIGKYDFDHGNLEIELTESNKTMDSDKLEEYLIQLKKLGVKISLDDMGNDYSTLAMLTMEEFDWVKLDRSLIIQLEHPKAGILIKHIINTCHDLNLKVIAEGVETDDVRKMLEEMNCDAYQGYLKSKPVSVKDFRSMFF